MEQFTTFRADTRAPEPLPPARIARLVDPRRQRVNADRVRGALEKLSEQLEGSVLPVQVRMLREVKRRRADATSPVKSRDLPLNPDIATASNGR